jgi:hypothetical protein
MRLGFDSISGDIGMKIATLSGAMRIDAGAAGAIDTLMDPGGGKRWDGTCTGCALSLSQVGGVTAGDASGPSRDFWISVLKTPGAVPGGARHAGPDRGPGRHLAELARQADGPEPDRHGAGQ